MSNLTEYPFHILAVDDNENNLFTLQSLLNGVKNLKLFLSTSGEEALKIAINEEIHLILLDIQMPGLDGFEVAKLLKLKQKTKDIPVVFLTAIFKSEEFFKMGYEVGAVDYLTKPIDDNLLLNKIKMYQTLFNKQKDFESEMQKRLQLEQEARKKEKLLIQQSKMAAMGEMIGAIAHQWRQPLNTLGLIIQDIEDAYEFGELDKKYLAKSVEKANNQIQYMSKTIDDFRNFFKPNKTREVFDIYKISKKALELLSAQLRNRGIKVEWGGKKQEKCEVYGYKNEFQQVVLNLITNARDAIMQRLEQNNKIQGLIKITLLEDKHHWILEFSDNGTGIKEEIIEKILNHTLAQRVLMEQE